MNNELDLLLSANFVLQSRYYGIIYRGAPCYATTCRDRCPALFPLALYETVTMCIDISANMNTDTKRSKLWMDITTEHNAL